MGVSYGESDDIGLAGNEDTGFGIGYVYSIAKLNTQLLVSYMHQELDIDTARNPGLVGVSVEDIDVFAVGARVQFD